MSGSRFTPIAVVGLGALLPGAKDVDGFWRSVLGGTDLVTDVPESHWLVEDYYDADPKAPDKTYGKRGAFLDPVDFDPLAFGMPPNQLAATDTTQLLSLLVADQVLKDAGRGSTVDRDKVSVILGTAPLELLATMASRLQRPVWLKALRESGVPESDAQAVCDRISEHYVPWQEASFPGLLSNVVAGRIANKFDLHGTNCTTDAACASSLAALSAGVNELALGQADLVVTGGVDTLNDITMYMCFSKTPALSPSGDCKPFSDSADGTILGEGLVMFALKRLEDAERDGDHVYAVVKGLGTASDGRSTAIYAPLAEGQARALRRAYESAGYGPETVELVEAHGTGTTAGDLAEFTALRTVFSESGRADSQWCALGSVKSQIGHTKSAAGAAGMLKAVLALNHKVLPPTIKVERPNPKLELESSPLYLNTAARPWIRDERHPRRASVSSFGFGGSNFHLTLEEYVPGTGAGRPAWRSHSAPAELILLSAATPAELLTHTSHVDCDRPLADIARETQSSFVPTDGARLSIVASSTSDLSAKLAKAVAAIQAEPSKAFTTPTGTTYVAGEPATGRVGFLFSGQGSQYVGMGADLAMEFPAARAVWDGFADVDLGERPLHSVVFPAPVFTDEDRAAQQSVLTATEWAQPALAAQSLAQLALLDALKISPEAVAGHSFGELVALHTAGAFDASALIRLARRRGEAMRDAATVPGVMLAVTGTHAQVALALSDVDGVWVANHNAPDQVVVSGSMAGIAAAERKFAATGLPAKRLATATAFHSPLVAPAVGALRTYLADVPVEQPRIDVFGNTDAAVYPSSPDEIRDRIAEHLAAPVRFVDEIEAMYAAGVRTFVEVGAGSTLTGMVSKILDGRPHLAVALDRKSRHGVTALYEALGKLAAHGVAAEFDALWSYNAPPAEPAGKPRMTTKLSGANYGKPYPPAGGASALPAPVAAPRAELAASVEQRVVEVTPEPAVAVVPESSGSSGSSELENLVLSVVAEKTGYPVEMLEGSMELEADLGIDSIKRVEILSAVRRASPDLPEVDPVELGKLRSLGEITARLHVSGPVTVAVKDQQSVAVVPVSEPAPNADLENLVLSVVAEKTGYPAEMLEGSMELEADLGIDSIKRVEILSAVRRAEPNLPEVDPVELGKLRSLGEIIARLHVSGPVAVAVKDEQNTVVVPAPNADLENLVLSVVAEKTGYPAEMLEGSMELEADLGIDSIKRVEILSAVRRAEPNLPEVDPVELGKLRSLGEIIARLHSADPVVVVTPEVEEPPAPVADLENLVLSVVAEKTGYPAEMLEGSMELEADLGIDSIKRVEILSAVRRAEPNLPEVDPVELGKLRSLGEIIARLHSPDAVVNPEIEEPSAPVADLEKLVLDVVAEKTGYPAEMLEGSMELEADLGIDSIKRVEIMSAVRRAEPNLPEVDPVELGKLRSLGEIIARLHSPDAVVTPEIEEPSAPVADLEKLVLDVVAEKTGYPAEMLEGSMELEADLGIDSIKRVEILSAVRRAEPNLPEVDPVELGKLRSLGEIIARLHSTGAVEVVTPVVEEPSAPVADLEKLVLDVVAEKTGYPAEMLEGSMELEADLGIDSIKRVEILSAVRRAEPNLPEVDPVELGQLRSLGEIIERLHTVGEPVAMPEHEETGLGRHAVRVVPVAEAGFALAGLRGGTLLVTDDGRGIAGHVVARLKRVGISATVHTGDVGDAYGVLHLGGLRDIAGIDDALEVQRDVFRTARQIAGRLGERGGVFVTVQDTGGDFGTGGRQGERAWLGGIAGLTRTAAREWPAAAVKAIDCERGGRTSAAVADAIVRELLRGGSTVDVGLAADGTRTTVEAVKALAEKKTTRVTRESVIVATGGARGVTSEALTELARRYQPKLVLLGRTPLAPEPAHFAQAKDEASLKRMVVEHAVKATGKPPLPAKVNTEVAGILAGREIRATLERIGRAGSEVRYEAVDARDAEALQKTLDDVRKTWGPITGIVHGAGVLADKRIADKTDDQFAKVFDTKVAGLRALLEATKDDPLDVLAVFSSISAHVGNPGQCDYAMANEVLNQVAHAQRAARPGLLVRSIAWGPWAGGMVSPSLAEHFEAQGVPLIPVDAGARAFAAELASGGDTHVVIAAGEAAGPIDGVACGLSKGEIQLNQQSHPYLADHDIEGTPVVPVALVLEWFAAAAKAWLPEPAVLKDVSVLRKIGLQRYTNGGNRVTVQGSSKGHLELLGDGDAKHYQAEASSGTPQPREWAVPTDLRPARADVYDGSVLFHGPQFQVIREVQGISRSGAVAVLAGARELGWQGAGWHTDPAAVDGGLQLALLWAEEVLGRASLPMGVAELRTHQVGLYEGRTRCVVQAKEVWSDGAECDIAFLGEDGSVKAELLGVSLVARPA